MAMKKFAYFLERVFYEKGGNTPKDDLTLTQEEVAKFKATMSEECGENVTEMAQQIIMKSQEESDGDEYPDICNVQAVLDTAGDEATNELIKKILENFVGCDLAGLEEDGDRRKQAILNAIEQTKQQAAALKAEKANDEQALAQAEREAETACTEAISQANVESERAIEEEKARSAAIIAEIRQRTDAATEAAKQQRDTTLESIAIQRAENEVALLKAEELAAETERQGNSVVSQIDAWLERLM